MLSHIDNSIFDSIVEILCMLPKIYSHKPPLADLTPKRRSLWARSCRSVDRNMSVGRPARSSSKAPLQMIFVIMVFLNVYLSYVASVYVMYLCFYFFQDIRNENCPNKGFDAIRTLQSRRNLCLLDYKIWKPSVTFWSVTFHQRFGRLVEFECIFWRFWVGNTFYLTVIKTYDLFKAIKMLGFQHFPSFFFTSFLTFSSKKK